MEVTLKHIYVNNTKANGEPLVSPKGDPYWSVVLDTQEQGKASKLFYNEDMIPKWQPGQRVAIEIQTNGNFKNWDFPKVPKGETPYSIQPENPTHNSGVYGYSQKNNPVENPPTQSFPHDQTQERIIRGMSFNNACTLLSRKEIVLPHEVKELAQSLYKEMYDWLNLKN